MSDQVPEVEAELEAFRQRWREEVSARNKRPGGDSNSKVNGHASQQRSKNIAGPSTARRKDVVDYSDDIEPRTYHDLPDKEESLKLGIDGQERERKKAMHEPRSALEHYEHAVEKETQGNLGESIRHYRRAYKLDDGVHEAYKRKHFPPSSFVKPNPTDVNPSNASSTVPNTAHHSLHGSGTPDGIPATLKHLVDEFSQLRIEAPEPPTSASPPERCAIGELPEEILIHILTQLAITDVAAFAKLAQVCKRLAYLVMTEESIWKRVAEGDEVGFGAMHYEYACSIEGVPLDPLLLHLPAPPLPSSTDPLDDAVMTPTLSPATAADVTPFAAATQTLLHGTYAHSWRQLFRSRPRLRFNGCYISTVNYTRAGAAATNTLTWGVPVHVVTYFRYLRFFRDGSAISLLTTTEPADVVHHLTKKNLHKHHGSFLPSSVMKDALKGRWRLTGFGGREERGREVGMEDGGVIATTTTGGGGAMLEGEREREGEVVIETEGVVPKYTYKLSLALAHAGKSARNNKLAWKGFWSYNKLTDDWAEFGLRNDRAFYWSRVKSYGMGEEV